MKTGELKEGEGREDGSCLRGRDGSRPRLIGARVLTLAILNGNDVLIECKFPPCGC